MDQIYEIRQIEVQLYQPYYKIAKLYLILVVHMGFTSSNFGLLICLSAYGIGMVCVLQLITLKLALKS